MLMKRMAFATATDASPGRNRPSAAGEREVPLLQVVLQLLEVRLHVRVLLIVLERLLQAGFHGGGGVEERVVHRVRVDEVAALDRTGGYTLEVTLLQP